MANNKIQFQPSPDERKELAKYSWRAAGATASESYLKSLCENSFLRFPAYAGVYRKETNGVAKEVCDVLVAFGDDVIIFSDKDCSWPDSDDWATGWRRWEKKAIHKSMNQLRGAQRVLESEDMPLYLDPQCSIRFPYTLPKKGCGRTHLIAVARGAAAKSRQYFKGGLGTFVLFFHPTELVTEPLTLTAQPRSLPFVHVFDEISIELLLATINTAKDLAAYLSARREFLTRGDVIVAHGEDELLGLYFSGDGLTPWDGRFPPQASASALIEVPPGLWESIQPFLKERSLIEQVGYLWDEIIDHMIDSITTGQLYFAYPATIEGQERVIRFLAGESRARRVLLAQNLVGLIRGTPNNQRTFRTIPATDKTESTFVFLVMPRISGLPEQQYRVQRRETLFAYCQILKLKYQQIGQVVGIASEPENPNSKSFDLVCLDLTDWKDEDTARAEEIKRRTGFMTEYKEWHMGEEELNSLRTNSVIFPPPKAQPYHPKAGENTKRKPGA